MLPLDQFECIIYVSRILCASYSIRLAYQSFSLGRVLSVLLTVIIFAELGFYTLLKVGIFEDPRLSSIAAGLQGSIVCGEFLVAMLLFYLIIGWTVSGSAVFQNANVWILFMFAIFPYIFCVGIDIYGKIKEVNVNPAHSIIEFMVL